MYLTVGEKVKFFCGGPTGTTHNLDRHIHVAVMSPTPLIINQLRNCMTVNTLA